MGPMSYGRWDGGPRLGAIGGHVASCRAPAHVPGARIGKNTHCSDTSVFLIASCVAKGTASVITYPHEVLRTRLQFQSTERVKKYTHLRHAIARIHAEEGLRGFYKGLLTNLFRVIPASAFTLYTYEALVAHCTHLMYP